jgi:hypothetical protein
MAEAIQARRFPYEKVILIAALAMAAESRCLDPDTRAPRPGDWHMGRSMEAPADMPPAGLQDIYSGAPISVSVPAIEAGN